MQSYNSNTSLAKSKKSLAQMQKRINEHNIRASQDSYRSQASHQTSKSEQIPSSPNHPDFSRFMDKKYTRHSERHDRVDERSFASAQSERRVRNSNQDQEDFRHRSQRQFDEKEFRRAEKELLAEREGYGGEGRNINEEELSRGRGFRKKREAEEDEYLRQQNERSGREIESISRGERDQPVTPEREISQNYSESPTGSDIGSQSPGPNPKKKKRKKTKKKKRAKSKYGISKKKKKKVLFLDGNVRVFLRIRPPTSEYTFINKIAKNKLSLQITKDFELKAFAFDKIIGPKEDQVKTFRTTSIELLKGILNGYNGCLVAYGQTGSGKTYTILGDRDKGVKGLLQFSLVYLLSSQKKLWLEMSAVQIYMENIYDLFDTDYKEKQAKNKVRRSMKFSNRTPTANLFPGMKSVQYNFVSRQGMQLKDLVTYQINSVEDVEEIIWVIGKNRRTQKTDMNDKSSRSHAVFMVKVHNPDFSGFSTFYLVDLAGSERVKKSHVRNKNTLDETISINSSLMALSKCISSLVKRKKQAPSSAKGNTGRSNREQISPSVSPPPSADSSPKRDRSKSKRSQTRLSHVPFRESKLTMLLQNCLLGKSMLGLIITISPNDTDVEESFSTLRFGQCAAKMEVKPIKHEELEKQKQAREAEEEEKMMKRGKGKKKGRKSQQREGEEDLKAEEVRINRKMEQLDREMDLNIQRNLSKNLKSLDASYSKNVFQTQTDSESNLDEARASQKEAFLRDLIRNEDVSVEEESRRYQKNWDSNEVETDCKSQSRYETPLQISKIS